jgi:LCP family protein required for cell wall assembly
MQFIVISSAEAFFDFPVFVSHVLNLYSILTISKVALMIRVSTNENCQRIVMSKKKSFFIVLSICVIIGLVSIYFYFNALLAKPLGPSLSGDLAEQPTSNFNQLLTPDHTTTQIPITQRPTLCGDTPVLTVLVAGIDYRGDNYLYGLSDVIRIVRVDFTEPKVTIFTLDRDIWVEIPGIEDHNGITHGKLNQAYFYGVPSMGYYDGTAGGAGLLAKTLKWNFGLEVDNYVVVSMAAFVKAVDALGGIDVYLPEPVDGTPLNGEGEGLGYFSAGTHHLYGTEALNLARIREKYSSLIRITNQDAIIKGLIDRIYSPDIILKIPELLQILIDTVLTDLSPNQINNMRCLIIKMDNTDLKFAEIPQSYYVQSRIYSPDMHKDLFIWDID